MTRCIGSPAQEMAESYLAGELPETEADRFENHYIGCESCHEYLITLQEIRDALAREPIAIVARTAEPVAPRRSFSGKILAFPVPLAVLASLAAALLVGVVLSGIQRSTPMLQRGRAANSSVAAAKPENRIPGASSDRAPAKRRVTSAPVAQPALPDSQLATLADVHLPGYEQPQLRGEEPANGDHLEFSTGMQAYVEGDCDRAIESLAKVPATAADGVAGKLYSGLCQLKGRELESAQVSFGDVIAAGDTPELETAEYFQAQTLLLRGDAAGAKNWLNQTIALHGDYEDRAQKQEALLPR
jgi:Putative zinc-finger